MNQTASDPNDVARRVLTRIGKPIKERKSTIWEPQPGPQRDAYFSQADELFYGGAAGGGKTDLALGLALTAHRKTQFFRRIYKDLRPAMDRSREILAGTGASLNEQIHVWRNIPGNRQLEFGAVQLDKDKERWKGHPGDLKVFDEVCDFTEAQYIFITAWARTTAPGQRVRTLCTGNPPTTPEGEWVLRRWGAWLDKSHAKFPTPPGQLRWYAVVDGVEQEYESGEPFTHNGEVVKPKSRTFIPARLTDNAFLRETDYGSVLQSLPEPLRSQLLNGDFTIRANDDIWQVIPTEWVLDAQRRGREREKPITPLTAVACDVARGGKDKTVIAKLYGNWFDPLIAHSGTETPNGDIVASLIAQHINKQTPAAIDVVGVGASPFDVLSRQGYNIIGINNGSGSTASDESGINGFVNLRAETYWKFREALDPKNRNEIALPDDRELLADLCAARYRVVGKRYQIEAKEDIQKRIGRSPDRGDAVVMAWHRAHNSISFDFVQTGPSDDYDGGYGSTNPYSSNDYGYGGFSNDVNGGY